MYITFRESSIGHCFFELWRINKMSLVPNIRIHDVSDNDLVNLLRSLNPFASL